MYEELVKRLRSFTKIIPSEHTFAEAADAIEELDAINQRQMLEIAVLSKPKWIPVTDKEHIPNTDHGVVGYFGGGAFNQLRWYDFVTTLSDGTIVGESTERDVINVHCIAVYKLPEPPEGK